MENPSLFQKKNAWTTWTAWPRLYNLKISIDYWTENHLGFKQILEKDAQINIFGIKSLGLNEGLVKNVPNTDFADLFMDNSGYAC